ncbi:uncharacterized protein LOC118187053 [Stegodyphus dumicola]|uniref:uncharacterized protein LOC118187053 n=1 Tax=Stegodyphus dumicola TaxID=202533 RepID=UPI0015AB480E|nr:uncharacterized protein LOC118187053 [Stegodyphus dumicola]
MSADTVAKTFFSVWISRFGVPEYVTTDQGRQFESQLFTALTKFLGTKKIRTSLYHPNSNGLVERFHRSLKKAIRCHTAIHWVDVLPTVLLGLRTAIKEDLGSSSAEMVYGTNLRLPGDFINPAKNSPNVQPHAFLKQLRVTMAALYPKPTSIHSSRPVFPKELATSSHVFLRCDASKKSLEPTYTGPHLVLSRTFKNYRILIGDKETAVSLDRLKPAFILAPQTVETGTSVPPPSKAPSSIGYTPTSATTSVPVPGSQKTSAPQYTRSGRRVRFNPRYL